MSDYEVLTIERYMDEECPKCETESLFIGLQKDFFYSKSLPIVFIECDSCEWEDTYKTTTYDHQIKLNKIHERYHQLNND